MDDEIDLDDIYGFLLDIINKKHPLSSKEYSLMRDGVRLAIDAIKFELIESLESPSDYLQ